MSAINELNVRYSSLSYLRRKNDVFVSVDETFPPALRLIVLLRSFFPTRAHYTHTHTFYFLCIESLFLSFSLSLWCSFFIFFLYLRIKIDVKIIALCCFSPRRGNPKSCDRSQEPLHVTGNAESR